MSTLPKKILRNKILEIHAEWLKEKGEHAKAKECMDQAALYMDKSKDIRQRRNYEKLIANSSITVSSKLRKRAS